MGAKIRCTTSSRAISSPMLRITDREYETLMLLVKGLNHTEIAGVLGISTRTVEYHIDMLASKARVRCPAIPAAYGTWKISPYVIVTGPRYRDMPDISLPFEPRPKRPGGANPPGTVVRCCSCESKRNIVEVALGGGIVVNMCHSCRDVLNEVRAAHVEEEG